MSLISSGDFIACILLIDLMDWLKVQFLRNLGLSLLANYCIILLDSVFIFQILLNFDFLHQLLDFLSSYSRWGDVDIHFIL